MPEITEQESDELQALRQAYGMDAIQKSISAMTSVKDDIDEPIRKVVVGLALLGCEPIWSCCGYDYPGQPIHKRHIHGDLYFCCERNSSSITYLSMLPILGEDPEFSGRWWYTMEYRFGKLVVLSLFRWRPPFAEWDERSYHLFGEMAQVRIRYLEDGLEKLRSHFVESAVIKDANADMRHRYDKWLYPPLLDWTVTPEDFK